MNQIGRVFLKSSLDWISSKNKVSGDVKIKIRETIKEITIQIPLEATYVCASQIIKPKFLTFALTENICPYLQKELNLKAWTLYWRIRISKFKSHWMLLIKRMNYTTPYWLILRTISSFLKMVFDKMMVMQFLNSYLMLSST